MSKKIAICVGHNAKYQGAISASGVTEYILNSAIANLLQYRFKDTEFKVKIFHRPAIKSYSKQMKYIAKKVNKFDPLIAIELHFNAGNSKARGHEVLYQSKDIISKEYAKLLNDTFTNILPNPNRGIKPVDKNGRGSLFLRSINAPTLIAEPFFAANLGFINYEFTGIVDSYAKFIQDCI